MRKMWKIVLGVIAAISVSMAIILIWQWDNVYALYMSFVYSDTKIEEKLVDNKKKLSQVLEQEAVLDQKVIEGFSKEDEEKIAKGEISVEDAINNLFENNNQANGSNSGSNENNSPTSNPKGDGDDKTQSENIEQKQKQLLQETVKEMYTLKANYIKKLAELERTGKRMYVANGMTMENKLKIADELAPQFIAAEKECDAKVEQVLKTLSDGLKELKLDTSVVESIREQYENEKQLQKTKYIKEYL